MRRYVRKTKLELPFSKGKPVTMAEEFSLRRAATTSLSICPAITVSKTDSGRQLVAKLPKTNDPLAGITSADFMKLAWRLATEKARELGWIV